MKRFRILYIISLLLYSVLFTFIFFNRNTPSPAADILFVLTGLYLIYMIGLTVYRGHLLVKSGRPGGLFANGIYLCIIFLLSYMQQLNIYLLAIEMYGY